MLVVGVAIVRHGEVLAAQRAYPDDLAGRWEFPGGKVGPDESAVEACVREVREELDCRIEVGEPVGPPTEIRPGLLLQVYYGMLTSGDPVAREHAAVRWLGPEQLDEVDWLPADRPLLAALRDRLLDGELLPGGNVGGAVRIGDTVRRPTGPWTPAVHSVLDHLRQQGLDCIPTVLGTDARGREVLTYLPGRVLDVDAEELTEAQLVSTGGWLRRFHDAVRGFRADSPVRWRLVTAGVGATQVVCHNDVAVYNLAFAGDDLAGVFDWDLVGPGDPLDDVAFFAWTALPLFRDIDPSSIARRLGLLCAAYGGYRPRQVLRQAVVRMRSSVTRIAAGQAAGDEGMLNLARVGEPARTRARIEDLTRRLPDIEDSLSRT